MVISNKPKRKWKAYSLLEIIVSMAIVSIILTMYSNILVSSIRTTVKTSARSTTREELNSVVGLMRRDLRNAEQIISCGDQNVPASLTACHIYTGGQDVIWQACKDAQGLPTVLCKVDGVTPTNILAQTSSTFKLEKLSFDPGFESNTTDDRRNIIMTVVASNSNPNLSINNLVIQTSISTRNYNYITDVPKAVPPPPAPTGGGGPSPLTGWAYRRSYTISNPTTATQTDFQVMVTLDTLSLISTNAMQAGCKDLRITASDGTTQLPYWVEPTTCNTAVTKIWAKVTSIPVPSTTIYAYYGNPTAAAATYTTANVFVREIPNLAVAYTMDEPIWNGVAGEVKDSSGNSKNATSSGATITGGKFGNGGNFNGSGAYVNTGKLGLVTPVTFSLWFRPASAGVDTRILSQLAGATTQRGALRLNLGGIDVWNGTAWVTAVPRNTIAANQWYYLTCAYSSGVVRMYLNGALKGAAATGVDFSASAMAIGAKFVNVYGVTFNGIMDDVRFYGRAITQAEITDLYGAGGDRQGYTTTNYPSKELVRKYNGSVSPSAPSAQQTFSTVVPTPTLISQSKPATESSVISGAPYGVAGLAVDGNTDGNYWAGSVTHTNAQAQAWWQVDLGNNYTVTSVKVWNRTDCCSNRLTNYNVTVLDSSSKVVWTTGNIATQAASPTTIAVPANVIGRYVKVNLSGTDYLSLAEVQVYGY